MARHALVNFFAALAMIVTMTACDQPAHQPPPQVEPAESAAIETVTTKGGVKMAQLPGGRFTMGGEEGDEAPRHAVTLAPFYIDVTEVTQAEFGRLVGYNPSSFQGNDRPVDQVRWTEAALYCNLRSDEEGLTPCYDEETWAFNAAADGYRLPTEAQWEFAARAGADAPAAADPDSVWFRDNTGKKSQPVAQKSPNAWGLHDMTGNLWEWTNDTYVPYTADEATDPLVAGEGRKTLRGGSWNSRAGDCRVTIRKADDPMSTDICLGYDTYGFRVARPAATGGVAALAAR